MTGRRVTHAVCGVIAALTLAACASSPPRDSASLCAVFAEKPRWHRAVVRASDRWDVPAPLIMAFLYKESAYRSNARPARAKVLGFIPWRRPSSAFGYAQATNGTWRTYQRDRGRRFAQRDRFSDAVDFVGWYHDQSHRRLGVAKRDARALYLAYYLGWSGYRSAGNRAEAQRLADRVATLSATFTRQFAGCRRPPSRLLPW